MKVYTIIPARYASTRLPRKMLLNETGKPLIVHTYESALKATIPDGVCVATDNDEIFNAVTSFGGQAIMTSTLICTSLMAGKDKAVVPQNTRLMFFDLMDLQPRKNPA